MIGISKERLTKISNETHDSDDSNIAVLSLLDMLINECKELDPWLPIEDAPKNRVIAIFDSGYGQVVVSWNEFYKCFTDSHGHKYLSPTHYKELDDEPNPD